MFPKFTVTTREDAVLWAIDDEEKSRGAARFMPADLSR